MGLLDALKQYISDAMPGGLLNAEVATIPGLLNDQANETAKTIRKKGQAFKRGLDDPQRYAGDALAAGMDMAGMAPLGLTVWHGSPHKFTKFDMSKIGTGEGAQAYGHGLYTGEAKEVGMEYMRKLAGSDKGMSGSIAANALKGRTPESAIEHLTGQLRGTPENQKVVQEAIDLIKNGDANTGYLYKVDIPDEAVARFLDWDKPLSQQAPEVQKAMNEIIQAEELYKGKYSNKVQRSGGEFIETLNELMAGPNQSTNYLREAGIPGIRYLDGGSRGAGGGTSNFVLFSDDMPRILEINGAPTGNVPWKPNEWKGLLAP